MAENAEEEDPKEYRWETGYEKTWEAIREDDEGMIDGAIADILEKAKRKRHAKTKSNNRLGMMRHFNIILDCTEAMSVPDLKPTRFVCAVKLLQLFIDEFYDQNPISQLGITLMKNKRSEKLTDLTGSAKIHHTALKGMGLAYPLVGEPSLQNALEMCMKILKVVPSHASREILVIMSSLTTCDPEDINITIENIAKEGIRCSVISLSSAVHVYQRLTQLTKGVFGCALDDEHFRDLLMANVVPPEASKTQENSIVKMGFPYADTEKRGKEPTLSMCFCHLSNDSDECILSTTGYHCPQCDSKYCELPVECVTCGLTLVSAAHLARSYHHLFPVAAFVEVKFDKQEKLCYACKKIFTIEKDKSIYKCNICEKFYCSDCDLFIHEVMHECVGCCSTIKPSKN